MIEYSDSEIIECLRKRQSYVVRYLSDRYLPMIKLMVYQMGGSVEDAKDTFQEGLMIMLEKINNKDFVLTCKFKTYLYSVCQNLWKSILVKRQAAANYMSRKASSDDENDFTELLDNQLYEKIFREVFESLDKVAKKILTLYWQEKSPHEISETLGYTYGYTRKKKCEAQRELIEKAREHPDYKRIVQAESVLKDIVY